MKINIPPFKIPGIDRVPDREKPKPTKQENISYIFKQQLPGCCSGEYLGNVYTYSLSDEDKKVLSTYGYGRKDLKLGTGIYGEEYSCHNIFAIMLTLSSNMTEGGEEYLKSIGWEPLKTFLNKYGTGLLTVWIRLKYPEQSTDYKKNNKSNEDIKDIQRT